MTYELAKKLKNAGFPQTFKIGERFYFQNDLQYQWGTVSKETVNFNRRNELIRCPTKEEIAEEWLKLKNDS